MLCSVQKKSMKVGILCRCVWWCSCDKQSKENATSETVNVGAVILFFICLVVMIFLLPSLQRSLRWNSVIWEGFDWNGISERPWRFGRNFYWCRSQWGYKVFWSSYIRLSRHILKKIDAWASWEFLVSTNVAVEAGVEVAQRNF